MNYLEPDGIGKTEPGISYLPVVFVIVNVDNPNVVHFIINLVIKIVNLVAEQIENQNPFVS